MCRGSRGDPRALTIPVSIRPAKQKLPNVWGCDSTLSRINPVPRAPLSGKRPRESRCDVFDIFKKTCGFNTFLPRRSPRGPRRGSRPASLSAPADAQVESSLHGLCVLQAARGTTLPELFWPPLLSVFVAFPVFYSLACVNRHGVLHSSSGKSQPAPDQGSRQP